MGLIDDFNEDIREAPIFRVKSNIKKLKTGMKEKRFWKELKDILRGGIRAPFYEIINTVESLIASKEEKSFGKGDDFEAYVVDLFPSDRFELCGTPPITFFDSRRNKDRFAKSNERPDFKFRDKRTNAVFWVECKYRCRTSKNKRIFWCEPKQFKRYNEFRKKTNQKVFVVIGLSGKPYKPKRLFCFDLDEVNFPDIPEWDIEDFERSPKQPFEYKKRRLI